MINDHQSIEEQEIDFYEELYRALPNHKPGAVLSLSDYYFHLYVRDDFSNSYIPMPKEAIEMVEHLPMIKDHLRLRDKLEISFGCIGYHIPNGMLELPAIWADPICEWIENTEWAQAHDTLPQPAFDWKSVKASKGSLEITFNNPIPHPKFDWEETAQILLCLHSAVDGALYNHWLSCRAKN